MKWAFAALSLIVAPVITAGVARAQGGDTDGATPLTQGVEDSRISSARDEIYGTLKASALSDEAKQGLADHVEQFVVDYTSAVKQGEAAVIQATLPGVLTDKLSPILVENGLAGDEQQIRGNLTTWIEVVLAQTQVNTSGNPGFVGSGARSR